ncbi:hypothetical protein HYH03_006530 [Edaphochlamys debaryana]|uniref:Kinesin-like protein n=1 Tax=Edaphochlamys debaryana TaxID=47281 RepID=A0A835Y2E1_9CHLO|nr:hypothetical protein HYH03_006530 [Edaphochlamys debaryana]|eukprot:KAG2495257.1 hypothetical protein HYH03_006530 [Edaphochlamys debaryana]
MPPQFKKPLEYNPDLAQKTLEKSFQHSEQAVQAKKRTLLAELGLDEEYDVEDEEEYEDDFMEGDEGEEGDEEPLLVTQQRKHTNGKNAVPSYGYRDLFGKEMEARRRQIIKVKGYDQYLADLLDRSQEQLQALRTETGLQYPGNVEVIPELQHELRLLHEELKGAREQQPGATSLHGGSDVSGDVAALQRQLSARDAKLHEAEAEAARLRAKLAAAGGEAEVDEEVQELERQLFEAKSALAAKDKEIATLRRSGGASSDLQRERDEAVQARELLQQQVSSLRSEMAHAEANLRGQQAAMAAASAGEQAAELQKQLWALTEQHSKRVQELEAELKAKQAQINQLNSTKSDALAAVTEMKGRMAAVKNDAAAGFKHQLQAVQTKLDELHALREGVLEELVKFQEEMFSDKTLTQMTRLVRDKEIARVRSAQTDLRTKLSDMDAALRDARDETDNVRKEAAQAAKIRELEAAGQIAHFQEKWRAEFEKRRKLHNMVLELKGNIRVLCRIRPLVGKEHGGQGADSPVQVVSEEALRVASVDNKAEKDFEFDRVLAPSDGQSKVYDEVAALVTSVLDGYNVAIMAYGQTGSGKTFTMEGPEDDPGVNLRALGDLFRLAADRSGSMSYAFTASVLEIYNEQIYDLLMSGKQDGDKLDVKQGPDGMYVPGLKQEEVATMDEVSALIDRGKSNRSTFATNMNEHSSRSHLVLSVHITCTSKINGSQLRGKLHLIDLAGSERLSRTGAQGDRLKEAQAINKSLSALGDVIQALQQRNAHIPYRNSKLTRLLEDSLGGNSKCVMIVNVSPAIENVGETKCSLEFASRARKVELGRARANVVGAEGSNGSGPSPSPSRPMSGARTPAGEGGGISRVGSRDSMATPGSRRPTPSGLSR